MQLESETRSMRQESEAPESDVGMVEALVDGRASGSQTPVLRASSVLPDVPRVASEAPVQPTAPSGRAWEFLKRLQCE